MLESVQTSTYYYKNGIYFHYLSVDLTRVGLRDAAVFVPKRYWMSKNRLLNCNLSIFEGRLKRLVRSKRPYNITSLWRLLQRTNMRLKNGLIASHHNFYQILHMMGHLFRSSTPLRPWLTREILPVIFCNRHRRSGPKVLLQVSCFWSLKIAKDCIALCKKLLYIISNYIG